METLLLMIQAVEQIIFQEVTYLRTLRLLKELSKMQLISSLMLPHNSNHSTMYALFISYKKYYSKCVTLIT